MIKNFIITDPLVSGEATFSNLNNSTTLSRRENNEGTREQISAFAPQRAWLSRITQQITEDYIFDSIGGANSFVYVIDTGFNAGHGVSPLCWLKSEPLLTFDCLRISMDKK